jgi:hypothetical protein
MCFNIRCELSCMKFEKKTYELSILCSTKWVTYGEEHLIEFVYKD